MRRLWRSYSLGIVLLGLFVVSWVLQTLTGWKEFVAEQSSLGATAHVFGEDGYVWAWGQATFENWQSEFLQLLSMVVLTSYLIYKGSTESKDGQERMQDSLDRIERRIKQLESAQSGNPAKRVAYGRLLAD